MLTEQQLRALAEPVRSHFLRLERDIIERICNRIRNIGRLTVSDARALDELQRIGYDMRAIQREVASTLSVATSQVYDIFAAAAEMEYNGMRSTFELTGRRFIPFAENEQLQRLVESISRAAVSDMSNMAHTIGFFNLRNHRQIPVSGGQFQELSEYYRNVIDYAALRVRTGQTDFYTAMRSTIRELADRGLTSVHYESGYHRRLDTAVRANMMDAQARLSMQQAFIVGEQFGADGMEVTYHSGPRPSHEWIGGIQVDMQTFQRDVQPVMDEANCYHRAFPIIMGISPPTYSPNELSALKAQDAALHEWGGRRYTAYEAQQLQRQYETEIRKQKDRVIAFSATGDTANTALARARAAATQAEYRRFSNAMGIQTKPTRARVLGLTSSERSKLAARTKVVNRVEAVLLGVTTSTGVKVREVSIHTVDRVVGRDVSAEAIKDALTNTLRTGKIRVNRSQQFIGDNATAVLNIDDGRVVTVWPTGTKDSARLRKAARKP